MRIISSKQVLFERIKYVKDEAEKIVHNVEEKILVAADTRPQIVPDWVKDEEHFKMLVEDNSIIEVNEKAAKPKGVSNKLKDVAQQTETPKAAFDEPKPGDESKPAEQTGWGIQA